MALRTRQCNLCLGVRSSCCCFPVSHAAQLDFARAQTRHRPARFRESGPRDPLALSWSQCVCKSTSSPLLIMLRQALSSSLSEFLAPSAASTSGARASPRPSARQDDTEQSRTMQVDGFYAAHEKGFPTPFAISSLMTMEAPLRQYQHGLGSKRATDQVPAPRMNNPTAMVVTLSTSRPINFRVRPVLMALL
jgi:hypothetical protein